MSDVDMVQRIDRLEDRVDEQGVTIERLRFDLANMREEMDATFRAIANDIKYLDENKKDDIRL